MLLDTLPRLHWTLTPNNTAITFINDQTDFVLVALGFLILVVLVLNAETAGGKKNVWIKFCF